MTAIDAWEEKYGSNEQFSRSARMGFDYELNVAYLVRVSAATVIKSKRDEVSLQLDVDVLDGDTVIGKSREWFTLPKQVTDERLSVELVRKLTFRRRDDLQRIYAASDPMYAKYKKRVLNEDGKATYLDFDGTVMTASQLRELEKTVNTEIMELSDKLHDQVGTAQDDLTCAEFYLVKAPNKRNPDYPYTNIFNHKPDTIPVFGED